MSQLTFESSKDFDSSGFNSYVIFDSARASLAWEHQFGMHQL